MASLLIHQRLPLRVASGMLIIENQSAELPPSTSMERKLFSFRKGISLTPNGTFSRFGYIESNRYIWAKDPLHMCKMENANSKS
ncbi:hypothetical protein M514_03004 [Trichuris suis]|uniref:Uncharacterized protein n=1 Tax=Trichuris suis TaxID=68888 RepID=A0A085MG80_9BILA|nr:hypothetical protein M513_03004 [Trichuris suis]KFD69113.1 hypothetical protein M514_03004 [Trichuris suis]KHJ43827.1 hypothetical protein D918_05879 [Trichuris suis]